MRFFISGAAPLAPEIAEFFYAAGITILEGYGLTETSPVICVNRHDKIKFGTVGPTIPGVEVRIAEDGEILARGPNIMKGYYKNDAATREALDPDGWFHTGDVGVVDSDGYLAITDRKKDLIVTAGGKNIAPQPIENRIKTNAYIAEIVLVGNRRKFPSALVVPDFEKLEQWAESQDIASGVREELVDNPKVLAFVQQQIDEVTAGLAQFEKIKKVRLLAREFTIDGGELTPTLKVKRRVIESRYKDIIDTMYT
jgi:long-chain acyl-CoA synthetase